ARWARTSRATRHPKAPDRTAAPERAPSAGRPSAAAGASEPSGGAAEALTARMAHGALSRGAPDGAAGPGPGCTGRAGGSRGRGGGGVPERGDGTRSPPCAQLRRRRPPLALEEGRTLRGPSLWETPEGEADIILRDLGHMWASGRLVVLNRRIPVACSAGRLPRQANVRGRRGGRARAAGRGRRGGGEQQKHEDEKEALKRGTKKLAPTRRRATLPRAREEPAGEARRRRASRRRHISGAPRRAEAARRRTGGSGERHQHTNSEVRADFEHIQSSA
ncbi:unnamed protein product, partial [Prorocentrum cordatum]